MAPVNAGGGTGCNLPTARFVYTKDGALTVNDAQQHANNAPWVAVAPHGGGTIVNCNRPGPNGPPSPPPAPPPSGDIQIVDLDAAVSGTCTPVSQTLKYEQGGMGRDAPDFPMLFLLRRNGVGGSPYNMDGAHAPPPGYSMVKLWTAALPGPAAGVSATINGMEYPAFSTTYYLTISNAAGQEGIAYYFDSGIDALSNVNAQQAGLVQMINANGEGVDATCDLGQGTLEKANIEDATQVDCDDPTFSILRYQAAANSPAYGMLFVHAQVASPFCISDVNAAATTGFERVRLTSGAAPTCPDCAGAPPIVAVPGSDGNHYLTFGSCVLYFYSGATNALIAVDAIVPSTMKLLLHDGQHVETSCAYTPMFHQVYDSFAQQGPSLYGVPPSDPDPDIDYFGGSVAIDAAGDTIVTGASEMLNYLHLYGYDLPDVDNNFGYAKMYERSGTTWAQLGSTVHGYDNNDPDGNSGAHFAHSVAISEDGLRMASVPISARDSSLGYGGLEIFDFVGSDWTRVANIDHQYTDSGWRNYFRNDAVSLSKTRKVAINAAGNVVAWGNPAYKPETTGFVHEVGNADSFGAVRVYQVATDGTYTLMGSQIDGNALSDQLGTSLALNDAGDMLLVGGCWDAAATNQVARGLARVFDWDGSNWVQRGPDFVGTTPDERLGQSVAMSGDGSAICLGIPGGLSPNHVECHDWDGSAWIARPQLSGDISDAYTSTHFGDAVAMSKNGKVVVVGEWYKTAVGDDGSNGGGRVHVFSYDNELVSDLFLGWVLVQVIVGPGNRLSRFGFSVDVSSDGTTVVIGSPTHDGLGGEDHGLVEVWTAQMTVGT